MACERTVLQLPERLLDRLDRYAARNGRSRSEVMRDAVDRYLASDREAAIDSEIVSGYAGRPTSDVWAYEAARHLIAAEPW